MSQGSFARLILTGYTSNERERTDYTFEGNLSSLLLSFFRRLFRFFLLLRPGCNSLPASKIRSQLFFHFSLSTFKLRLHHTCSSFSSSTCSFLLFDDSLLLALSVPAQKAQGATPPPNYNTIVLKSVNGFTFFLLLYNSIYDHPYSLFSLSLFELFFSHSAHAKCDKKDTRSKSCRGVKEKISLDSHPSCQPLIQMLPHRRSE